jgi:hypothetical protein
MMGAWATAPAWACSVPVFRWALERWTPDAYDLAVFHRGPLAADDQRLVDAVTARAKDQEKPANLEVHLVDVDTGLDEEWAALWGTQGDVTLPWAVLRSPKGFRYSSVVWAGSVQTLSPDALFDSPQRTEIVRRILEGESAVWVLLESGDLAKDDAAAQLLRERLAGLQKTLRLPDMTGDPVLSGREAPDVSDLRVAFSLLRVSRQDPAEDMLVRMLLGSEPDLASMQEPIALPVFGRGRVLYAFVGAGINAENVAEGCAFLVGRCSCEIKEANPGTDLLTAADWEGEISSFQVVREIVLPPLPGAAGIAAAPAPDLSPAQTPPEEARAAPPAAVRASKSAVPRNVLAVVAVVVGVAIVATLATMGKNLT